MTNSRLANGKLNRRTQLVFDLSLIIALMIIAPQSINAKYVEGSVNSREQWLFLTRFCFVSGGGTFHYTVEYDAEFAVQRLLLYYDTADQWPAVYRTDTTCRQKLEVLDDRRRHQFINLSAQISTASGCVVRRRSSQDSDGKDSPASLMCRGNRTFRSARQRWWFIALANCDSARGLSVRSYSFLMTNGEPDDVWQYQFSADETQMLKTVLLAGAVQATLLVAAGVLAVQLRSRCLLHTTYKMFIAATALHLLALLLLTAALGRYALDGIGLPRARLTGRVIQASSDMVFLLLLLLCAKGYTITRARLRQAGAVRLTIFMCLYVVVWALLFMHEQLFFDPGLVTYIYESPAGHGLVVLRLIGWLVFVYSTAFTIKHYPEKWSFYLPFSVFYTLWFISAPLVILFANYLIDNWVREKIVFAVELAITAAGHTFFLYLTRPAATNTNFPFHVRTSQISVMESSEMGVAGVNTLHAFTVGHTYATALPSPAHIMEMFTTNNDHYRENSISNTPYVKRDGAFPHASNNTRNIAPVSSQ